MDILCFVIGPNPGSNKSASGTKMRSVTKLSGRRERCIVTCKKKKKKRQRVFLFLALWFFLVSIFLLSSHFSKCVCVTLEAHQRLRSWVYNELMEKDPQCAGKKNLFCQEHCLFCVCVVISQTLLYSSACVPLWQQTDILHMKIHPLVRVCGVLEQRLR